MPGTVPAMIKHHSLVLREPIQDGQFSGSGWRLAAGGEIRGANVWSSFGFTRGSFRTQEC